MDLELVLGYDRQEEVLVLFNEYTQLLLEGDPRVRDYLELQGYGRETEHLEEKYGLPRGRLYLALWQGEPAGCAAFRPLDDERCEAKRFYVRPQYRRLGVGQALADKVMDEARAIGYKHILLDTLPFLDSAIRMYRRLGFYEIDRYNDSPLPDTIYMQLDLEAGPGEAQER